MIRMMRMAINDKTSTMKDKNHSIVKAARIRSLYAPKEDANWWRSQPYAARLAALEEIRQEFHRWKYGTEPRFQRVYRIIKLKESALSGCWRIRSCFAWVSTVYQKIWISGLKTRLKTRAV